MLLNIFLSEALSKDNIVNCVKYKIERFIDLI